MKRLFALFFTFAKIGLFTFGGGYAMLGFFERECVEKKQWISHEDMLHITAIAESTPGPVAVNFATFVGYRQKKLAGALCATLGMVTPSFLLLLLISLYFERFLQIPWVAGAFWGIKIAVAVLIIDAALRLLKKIKKTALSISVLLVSCAAMLVIDLFSLKITSVLLIVLSAFTGWLVYRIKTRKGGSENDLP